MSQEELEPGELLFSEKHVEIRQQTPGRVSVKVGDCPGDIVDKQALVEALSEAEHVS